MERRAGRLSHTAAYCGPDGLGSLREEDISMSKKTKAKADTALPKMAASTTSSDTAKVGVTRTQTTAMQASSLWSGSPELQSVTTGWNKAADALETNGKGIADLRKKLAAAIAQQHAARRDWKAAQNQVLATVASVCQGSVDQVLSLGFKTRTSTPVGALSAPTGLTVGPGMGAGDVLAVWERGSARHGFIVQHATDVANVATYSGNVPSTRVRFTLTGQAPATVVHFRVAAVDPSSASGMSPWSDWVAGTAK